MYIGKPGILMSGGNFTDQYSQRQSFKISGEGLATAFVAVLPDENNNDVGHGIGRMRKAPQIPNGGSAGLDRVKSGMTLAQPNFKKGRSSCLNKM